MSVYKRQGRETYSYDFRWRGGRYSGDTGCKDKRAAERIEAQEKRKLQQQTRTVASPMTVGIATGRYWMEVGQHHARSDGTLAALAWLDKALGKSKLMSEVSDSDVAHLIALRRSESDYAPATINRTVTQPLRALLTRAAKIWKVNIQTIEWGKHLLKEPQERVRELSGEEEARLFAELRADFHPIVRFALWTGCRREECLNLEWRHIDWRTAELRVTGKGRKTRTIPMSNAVQSLLKALPRANEKVFTYEVQKPRGGAERLPMTANGLRMMFDRSVRRAGIEDFRFHDLRHTCATRLLRQSGNLRLAQRLLGHTDIATTMKYAHVTNDDLRNALNSAEGANNIPTKSGPLGGKSLGDMA